MSGKQKIERRLIKGFKKTDALLIEIRENSVNLCAAIKEAQEELDDLHDLAIIYGRFDEANVPWDVMRKRLHDKEYDWIE